MMAKHLTSHALVPFYSIIHLPSDPRIRRQVLVGMNEEKLAPAQRFILAWQQATGSMDEERQIDAFVDVATDDRRSVHWEITHFHNAPAAAAVFQALLQVVRDPDMHMSEKTGTRTLRDGDGSDAKRSRPLSFKRSSERALATFAT